MGAQGSATLDFGSFPGSNVATVDVVATGVVASSAVEAWLGTTATADHTDTDHIAAPMKVVGAYLSDNNIRIYGLNTNDVIPPLELQPSGDRNNPDGVARPYVAMGRQNAPMFVGQFSVSWVWN